MVWKYGDTKKKLEDQESQKNNNNALNQLSFICCEAIRRTTILVQKATPLNEWKVAYLFLTRIKSLLTQSFKLRTSIIF